MLRDPHSPRDVDEWESVRGPQLSPDGTTIVFTRGGTDMVNDKRRSVRIREFRDGQRP